jgi:hypothetical protein
MQSSGQLTSWARSAAGPLRSVANAPALFAVRQRSANGWSARIAKPLDGSRVIFACDAVARAGSIAVCALPFEIGPINPAKAPCVRTG